VRALSIQRLEGSPWLWDLIGAGLRREVWQAGVVGRRSGCVRDGVGLLCEEPHGNGSRREKKGLGRGPRDAEVVCVSKHVDGSRLELWFHAAYSHGNGGARSWICAAESLSITRKCHREPIRAFISEQTRVATSGNSVKQNRAHKSGWIMILLDLRPAFSWNAIS
jgi:hypothetical protein